LSSIDSAVRPDRYLPFLGWGFLAAGGCWVGFWAGFWVGFWVGFFAMTITSFS
jgi:hypothetical protein